jgi:hypothetical protein
VHMRTGVLPNLGAIAECFISCRVFDTTFFHLSRREERESLLVEERGTYCRNLLESVCAYVHLCFAKSGCDCRVFQLMTSV